MVQVTVSDGILEGELVEDELVTFYSFKGIPYAAPPVGELRFKSPQPMQPWNGVRPAKKLGSMCCQIDVFLTNKAIGSEDCLYLNVYTPDLTPKKPLPVMVWIHGGGFMSGSGNDNLYGPEYLIRQGVILVSINYRLEVLGFLCLDSEEVPGNAGMKDQVAALRWVNRDIRNFGGDPENVTIFGESAGGASVSAHTLSPMSKGLFKRAIAQSGTATSSWSTYWNPVQVALSLARKLGFYSENKTELYEFFKSQPLENLIGSHNVFTMYDIGKAYGDLKFVMALEKDFGQERFLVGDPYETLYNGIHEGVDIIVGYNEEEGIFWEKVLLDMEAVLNKIKRYDDFLVPKHIALNVSQNVMFEVGKRFKEYYFRMKYEPVDEKIIQIFKYFSIEQFVYSIMQWAKICSKKNSTYVYKFTCKSERNFMTHVLGLRKHLGNKVVASHTDDLPYLFPVKITGITVDRESEEFKLIDQVTKLWTNFAKYGNPTPDDSMGVKWNPYTVEDQEYLEIGNQLKADFAPFAEEMEFWEGIYKEFCPKYVSQSKL